jgi:hypothetical protein
MYRPPVKIRPLITAIVHAFVIWYPYLHYEVTRNFVDIANSPQATPASDGFLVQSGSDSHTQADERGTLTSERDQIVPARNTAPRATLQSLSSFWERGNVILTGSF